jgi:hypothetical protein
MNIIVKKITAYALSIIVLTITVLAVLAIWDIIELEDILRKVMASFLVIFVSSVVTLFIFNVVLKDS